MAHRYPLFVKRDLDGFFGLFIDNLVQLLLIVQLCSLVGMGGEEGSRFLYQYILPGAAVSILIGNIFYAWQAHRLAAKEERDDITALPYGINTPSLLVYVFFVMLPVFAKSRGSGLSEAESAEAAWKMGLLACLGSGVIEFAGAFVAEQIRRRSPRAALLSTLAGIAMGFIAMKFALEIFERPLVAMLPLALILITYFSRMGFPLGLPGGLVAVLAGTACAWGLPWILPHSISGPPMDPGKVADAWNSSQWSMPHFVGHEVWALVSQPSEWLGFLSVIVPMGLFNVIGSLQNIESAEASGDAYDTRSALAANGIGTIAAALFGSCFPTTIYIGHPGWKGLGARAGYSTLNGLVVTLICLTGTIGFINSLIPMQAGIAIVLWIGVIITAQAFQATPKEHAPAVAIGLFPAIAAWGATVMLGTFMVSGGQTAQDILKQNLSTEVNGFLIHGMILMERGYIFTCMILGAVSALLIDRRFYAAASWSAVASACAFIGLTHAYQLQGNIVDFLFVFAKPAEGAFVHRGTGVGIGYLLFVLVFLVFGWLHQRNPDAAPAEH